MRFIIALVLLAGCTTFGDEDLGDEGWLHPGTGRVWTQWPVEASGAENALAYCDGLLYGTWRWRLPTVDELRTLFDGAGGALHPGAAGFDLASATVETKSPIDQRRNDYFYWNHEKRAMSGGFSSQHAGVLCIEAGAGP